MTTTSSDPPTESFTTEGPDARTYERYAQVKLEENVILLYDREKESAWISSDDTITLAEAA